MTKSFQSHKILMADFRQEMNLGAKEDRVGKIQETQMKGGKIIFMTVPLFLHLDTLLKLFKIMY
jgi:hypothetical protein